MGIARCPNKDSVKAVDSAGGRAHKRVVAGSEPLPLSALKWTAWRAKLGPEAIAGTSVIVGLATLAAHLLDGLLPSPSLVLLFLVAVLVAAVRYGFWMGIAASVATFLAYNFFFVEPRQTLRVDHAADVLTLLTLLAAGATTGSLAGRLREVADAAAARATTLERLSGFARDLVHAAGVDEVKSTMLRHLAQVDGGSAAILHPQAGRLVMQEAIPATLSLSADDLQAAERVFRRGGGEEPAAPGWGGSAMAFRFLGPEQGVIGFTQSGARARFSDYDEQVRRTIVQQGRLALEKAGLARAAEAARHDAEREATRSALLSSLSHDLKTPLATILGGVSSLRELGAAMSAEARADLLAAIEEEAERLSRYVTDLLHLTRLKSGLDPQLDWIDAVDAVHGAIERARRFHAGRSVTVEAPEEHPLVLSSAVLLEQAIFNLVDNALKFSAPDGAVRVLVAPERETLRITVIDRGAGIPQADLPGVFEPFFRGRDTGAAGTGLGLSIVQGIAHALSGSVTVESPVADESGTVVHFRLPLTHG